jgi:hypothetical protein
VDHPVACKATEAGSTPALVSLVRRLVAEAVKRRGENAQTEVRLLPSRLSPRERAQTSAKRPVSDTGGHSPVMGSTPIARTVATPMGRGTARGGHLPRTEDGRWVRCPHVPSRAAPARPCPRNSANRVPGFEPGGRRFESCRGLHRDVGKPGLTRLPWEQETARSNRAIPTSRERPGYRLPGPGCNPVASGRCWFDSSLSHRPPPPGASGCGERGMAPGGPHTPASSWFDPALATRGHAVAVV